MSDFARMMELAMAGGATAEDITGTPPAPLSEQQAEAEKAKVEQRRPAPADHRESRDKK